MVPRLDSTLYVVRHIFSVGKPDEKRGDYEHFISDNFACSLENFLLSNSSRLWPAYLTLAQLLEI